MRHLLLMDPLEKLVVSKDTTAQLALTMKDSGCEVYLLFERDFFYSNLGEVEFTVYEFEGAWEDGGPYLSNFSLSTAQSLKLKKEDCLHMRLDPPFDTRYLRYLWMLKALGDNCGVKVLNSAEGIMLHNEKLFAYQEPGALESFVGLGSDEFIAFSKTIEKKGYTDLIFKPLDLYQGIGVEKVSLALSEGELKSLFEKKVDNYNGPVVVQPFDKKVESGEVRTIFFKGRELGSILKVPPAGEFLANIAQGASYDRYELTKMERAQCDSLSKKLESYGADWIAFDILGENVQEVNITCPGLLVEVSKAMGENLAADIVKML